MGLDMYLEARRHISGYSFSGGADIETYHKLVNTFGMADCVDPDTPSAEVNLTVGYWRKANQIHAWFVENVQYGKDDCHSYYVSPEKLIELRDLCTEVLAKSQMIPGSVHTGTVYDAEHPQGAVQLAEGEIIADPTVAHELLPTEEGFFFGSTDYDEGYVYDLKRTIEIINRVLTVLDMSTWSVYYQSSW